MNIDIQVDDKAVRDALKGVEKQAPFALSLALNNVTKDAQTAIREGLASRFTLRQPEFIRREGAKITQFATKAKPEAIVQVTERAAFLAKFEEGDTKTPKDGKALAIPVAARRNKRDIIPKSQRPPALYQSAGARAGRVFSHGGRLLQRVGRGAAAVVRVLYVWKSSAKVPAMLRFTKTANEAVDKQWRTRAHEAVDKALASMR